MMSSEMPRLRQALQALAVRARALAAIRAFFTARGYLEVDTPLLSGALIPESTLEVFRTTHVAPTGRLRQMFLVPSPELWMKRLLACGSGSIYQVCRSFRNCEPEGPLHNPEFTMLEWYTAGADYRDSMDTMQQMLAHLLDSGPWPEASESLRPPLLRLSMNEAFARHLGTALEDLLGEARMRRALRAQGLKPAADDSWADGFHKLFLACVEPALSAGPPVILYDYPAEIPTLARDKPGTPWAERWELYVRGVEVANCYSEETDPARLRRFFSVEAARKGRARVPHPTDEALLRLLEKGLPACSGTALGVDRLLMLLLGVSDIRATGLLGLPPAEPRAP